MKTLAQQLNIKEFPFIVKDSKGNEIYYENSKSFWWKREYDTNGNENKIYYEDSDGLWIKREYDSNGNETYYEDSDGLWAKREYDSKGNRIYYEDSNGDIRDSRPKVVEMTMEEICNALGKNIKIIK